MATKSRKTKATSHRLFPDELIDQLLAQIQNKNAGSILGESSWQASSRNSWPGMCKIYYVMLYVRVYV
jgi:hypothetical protein